MIIAASVGTIASPLALLLICMGAVFNMVIAINWSFIHSGSGNGQV